MGAEPKTRVPKKSVHHKLVNRAVKANTDQPGVHFSDFPGPLEHLNLKELGGEWLRQK
jgi:hypothetical protein